MEIQLRDYQTESIQKVLASYEHNSSGSELIVLPTGAGKTIIASDIIRQVSEKHGTSALIVAHRDELLEQAADKYRMIKPDAIIGKVGSGVHEYGGEVTVASIQTIFRREHIKRLQALYGTGKKLFIWIDEAHHSMANSYQIVLESFPDAFVLMVTATPDRLDGKPLLDGKKPLYEASIIDLATHEPPYLTDIRAIPIQTGLSLDGLHTQAGDFKIDELEAAVDTDERNQLIVSKYQQYASGRRAACFAVTVEHAEHITEAFNDAEIPSAVVVGETPLPERKRIYKAFRDGSIRVLTTVNVLSEGWDEPLCDCIIMARPTQSRALFVQCLDTSTQILTPNGWKSHNEIHEDDIVAGFNTDTEQIQWVPVLDKAKRPLAPDEKMYSLQSPTLDIRVTGGHRMLFRARKRRNYKYTTYGLPEWRFKEAQELYQKNSEYEIPISGIQAAPGVPLTNDELRFIGWFLTDGTLNKQTNGITIYQAEHQPHHEAIKSCLEGCGFKYTVYKETPKSQHTVNSDRIRYHISKGKPRGTDKHLTGWERLEPYIDKNLSPALEDMTVTQLETMLEAIHLGDGAKQLGQYWTRRSYHIITGNKTFAERLQSLCVRRGFKCNLAYVQREGIGNYYQIHIKKKTIAFVGGKNYTDRPHFEISPSIPGEIVWCVSNELGTLVTRRNGKVAIVGNCLGRGLRLAPGKKDCIILDITDNCLKHRLEPQSLRKILGKKLNPEESLLEALEREKKEVSTSVHQERKLKEQRNKDIELPMLVKLDWHLNNNGTFVLLVGKEQHRIALVPDANGETYSVWARLAPMFEAQCWLEYMPLDWCQSHAEKRARLLLSDAKNVKLVDKTARWRNDPASQVQLEKLEKWAYRFSLNYNPSTITKGEASELLDYVYGEFEKWRNRKGQKVS